MHCLHMTYMTDRQPRATAKITGATRIACLIFLLVKRCSKKAMSTRLMLIVALLLLHL